MNQKYLIEAVRVSLARQVGCERSHLVTKLDAFRALASVTEAVLAVMSARSNVSLPGIGKFGTKDKAARSGRNPQTGEAMRIAARRVVRFKPSTALKEAAAAE